MPASPSKPNHSPSQFQTTPKDGPISEEGKAFLARQERFRNTEGAYAMELATTPQTWAAGLNDSPAGLAAWIVEKLRTWSDCDGDGERRFTKDELLTNIAIYRLTGSTNSSFLLYYELQFDPPSLDFKIDVPTGVALFPGGIPFTGPREWAEPLYNITRWPEMPRGGHFPTSEEPDLYAAELREFFRPLRYEEPADGTAPQRSGRRPPGPARPMTYVAFLRAINVGGNSIIPMVTIKAAMSDLGFSDVRTYMNSGNVIFSTSASDTANLTTRIESAVEKRSAVAVKVLTLSRGAMKKIVDAIPASWMDDRVMRCYVMLLWKEVDNRKILDQLPTNPTIEDVKYIPGAVIWRLDRKNLGKSRMMKIVGTPLYKQMTLRSVNTVRKLNELIG